MAVNFFLRNKKKDITSIDAIVRFKGKRYKLAIGVSVIVDHWIPEKNRVKELKTYQDASAINAKINEWETLLIRTATYCKNYRISPSIEEFKKILERFSDNTTEGHAFISFIEDFIKKSKRSKRTKLGYNSTKSALENYQAKRNIHLKFEDLNMDFYYDFKDYIESENKSLNYFGTLIKNIKVFMNEAKEAKLHNNNEYQNRKFKTLSETADSIYLNEDELLKIYHLKITDEKIIEVYKLKAPKNLNRIRSALELVRNKFLIGAYTGLRVSDFNHLREIHIKNGFIHKSPTKGSSLRKNEEIKIPIHWVIQEILDNGFDITQKISDQKINKHIKTICKMAGIDDAIVSYKTVGGIPHEEIKPKYAMVSTHTARRSAATNMFKDGIEPIRIMKITGHRTQKSFMKYIKIDQEENAQNLSDHSYFKKKPK